MWIQRVVAMGAEVREEKYVVPHSLCELGEMYTAAGRHDDARQALLAAKAYSNYDLDKPLNRRIASALG
jgi:hypothetical protein